MSSNIHVSLDNPYGQVTIPRAKLRSSDDAATVIANPMALNSNEGNPYGSSSAAPPPPYMVKEDGGGDEEEINLFISFSRRNEGWKERRQLRRLHPLRKTMRYSRKPQKQNDLNLNSIPSTLSCNLIGSPEKRSTFYWLIRLQRQRNDKNERTEKKEGEKEQQRWKKTAKRQRTRR
ncbi:unnamed protein product [Pleuronectes platessa]|uniref:Uncharacterized protein n=1 Tax=Pleuronectes platessa TaxID=8262 RepID=A0A9N7U1X7_PLEPL|nr:unnamed protein product [Pleuronectes platessa]